MLMPLSTSGILLAASILSNSVFTQFSTVEDIPLEYFSQNQIIYGRVDRIIDGDTIRVTHCPTYFSCPERGDSKHKQKIADTTIKVRMYGIDCPELQKKESDPPSQPFAKEAKDYMSLMIKDKTVEIKLLEKDQYGRAVSRVQVGPSQDLSLDLLSRGYATMYMGKGAVFDNNKKLFEAVQSQARERKVGIWSLGDRMVSPGEFKRQQVAYATRHCQSTSLFVILEFPMKSTG